MSTSSNGTALCRLAFYTSPSEGRIGYCWVWTDPGIPAGLPERLYSALRKPLTTSVLSTALNAGVISLGDAWCAVYRWIDAGRDAAGRSGKLGLIAAFLPRSHLQGLDLLAVLNAGPFATATEVQPAATVMPVPRFPAPPPPVKPGPDLKRELPGLHSYPELLASAAAFVTGGFLLEVEKGPRGESCRLLTYGDESRVPLREPMVYADLSAVLESRTESQRDEGRMRMSAVAADRKRVATFVPWVFAAAVMLATVVLMVRVLRPRGERKPAAVAGSSVPKMLPPADEVPFLEVRLVEAREGSHAPAIMWSNVDSRARSPGNARIAVREGSEERYRSSITLQRDATSYDVDVTIRFQARKQNTAAGPPPKSKPKPPQK